jgi:hypothetical protein
MLSFSFHTCRTGKGNQALPNISTFSCEPQFKKQVIQFFKQNILFGLCYVILSLLIGDCHPFSLVSMYDSFPESATTFYLSDKKGKLLPLKSYYHYGTGDLTHFYGAFCESKNFSREEEAQSPAQLNAIGEAMISELEQHKFAALPADTVQVHQVYYFFKDGSLHQKDNVIYESGSK